MRESIARRQKESLGERLDLAPVRLLGGFVCVDTHLGCIGCAFCLNRRYPATRRVLESGLHASYRSLGFAPDRIAEVVRALPSYARAGVPVRIGNLTDVAFGADDVRELVERLDPRHPVLLASRFPVRAPLARTVRERENVLLHLTLTPRMAGTGAVASARVIASAAELPPERVFWVLGPLAEGCAPEVERLFAELPAGATIGLKELKVDAMAEGGPFVPMGLPEIDRLRERARAAGLRVLKYAGCLVRRNLGIPFFRHREAARIDPEGCATCPNRAACEAVREPSVGELAAEVRRLGLEPRSVRIAQDRITVAVDEPAARAEEVYLAERFKVEVQLTGVWRGDRFRVVELGEQLLARWERAGFYPVAELARAAEPPARPGRRGPRQA